MSFSQAQVSKILTWSCVDGPGNRMVLFLQGCNFSCLTCHNPHTIGQCNHCGECLPACPTPALSMTDGRIAFDPDHCTKCDACLEACPISANPMVRSYKIEEILTLLHEHKSFLSGITVSGGEATMQLPFIQDLFRAMGEDPALKHLTRFIDTNGHLGPQGWKSLIEVTDGVMLDIKAFDPEIHQHLTGRGNSRSLEAARLLHETGKLHELRYLMIPGQTDSDTEIEQLKAFAASLGGPVRIRLNAYRTHGVRGEAADWPALDRDRIEAAAAILENADIGPVLLPAIL